MTIEFTDWARDILKRSHEAARRFNPNATVRVYRKDGRIEFELADAPRERDRVVHGEGFEILVEEGIDGVIDVVEPHDQLILRPADRPPAHP
jgi:hypothetical protein